jgi:hypothetical protein
MDCSNQPDGLYGHGCRKHFSSCHNGNHASQACPYGLHYDAEHAMCNYPGFIAACNGGRRHHRNQRPMESSGSSSEEQQAPMMQPQPPMIPPPSGSGAGQLPSGGGGYGGGYGGGMNSGMGGGMNSGMGGGMNGGMSGGSGGQRTSNTGCARGTDGYFSFGCSSRFFYCLDNNAVTIDCPAGLFYDQTRGLCDYSANVIACGGNPGTTMQ